MLVDVLRNIRLVLVFILLLVISCIQILFSYWDILDMSDTVNTIHICTIFLNRVDINVRIQQNMDTNLNMNKIFWCVHP